MHSVFNDGHQKALWTHNGFIAASSRPFLFLRVVLIYIYMCVAYDSALVLSFSKAGRLKNCTNMPLKKTQSDCYENFDHNGMNHNAHSTLTLPVPLDIPLDILMVLRRWLWPRAGRVGTSLSRVGTPDQRRDIHSYTSRTISGTECFVSITSYGFCKQDTRHQEPKQKWPTTQHEKWPTRWVTSWGVLRDGP